MIVHQTPASQGRWLVMALAPWDTAGPFAEIPLKTAPAPAGGGALPCGQKELVLPAEPGPAPRAPPAECVGRGPQGLAAGAALQGAGGWGAGSARLRGGPPILTPNFRVMCGAGLVAEVTSEKVRQRPGRPPAWGVQGVDAALVRAERRATSRTSCHSETPARGAASRSPASPQHKAESDPRLCWAGSSGGWG